jgi:ADP-ribose pyrophosphatase YjhB (NUDIX family)
VSERGGGSDATGDGPSRERDDRTLAPDALVARYDGVRRRSNRIELPAEQFDGLVADEGRWGVGALVTHEGRALLVREGSKASDWVLPGGKLEAGERHAEGAAREVYEETGVEVVVEDLLAVSEQTFVHAEDGRSFEYYFATFGATPVGDPAATASDPGLAEEDIVAVEWHAEAPDDALDRDLLVDLMGW